MDNDTNQKQRIVTTKTVLWDCCDPKVLEKLMKEVDKRSSHLLPNIDTIQDAIDEQHNILVKVSNEMGIKIKRIRKHKSVVWENEINWSKK